MIRAAAISTPHRVPLRRRADRFGAMAAALMAVAGCSGGAETAAPAPMRSQGTTRIVSINPCVDAILMQVADHADIAGISHYSHDPHASSIPVALARRFVATSGTAEEVIALRPTLVITGPHADPATIGALRRLRVRVVQVGVPATIAESNDQVRTIAAAIGRPARGARLIARTLAARALAAREPTLSALIWQGEGLVPGGGTLADEMLRASGFRNASADYGLNQWDVLPLEQLVARPPRVLLAPGEADREDRMLRHPVLGKIRKRIAVRAFASRLLQCGGPTIIDALARLRSVRASL